jgi:hypothetical protein
MYQSNGAERRRFGRKETNIEAQVLVPGRAGVRCVIRNISQMGALLDFGAPFSWRGNFRLIVDGNRLDAQCQIRRQDGTSYGVEFVSIAVHELAPPVSEDGLKAPLFEAAQKPELVASSGRELRAWLFGRPMTDQTPPPSPRAATLTRVPQKREAVVPAVDAAEIAAVAPSMTKAAPAIAEVAATVERPAAEPAAPSMSELPAPFADEIVVASTPEVKPIAPSVPEIVGPAVKIISKILVADQSIAFPVTIEAPPPTRSTAKARTSAAPIPVIVSVSANALAAVAGAPALSDSQVPAEWRRLMIARRPWQRDDWAGNLASTAFVPTARPNAPRTRAQRRAQPN